MAYWCFCNILIKTSIRNQTALTHPTIILHRLLSTITFFFAIFLLEYVYSISLIKGLFLKSIAFYIFFNVPVIPESSEDTVATEINVVDNYRATYYQQKSRMLQPIYLYGFRGIAGIIPKPKQNYTCTNAISAH